MKDSKEILKPPVTTAIRSQRLRASPAYLVVFYVLISVICSATFVGTNWYARRDAPTDTVHDLTLEDPELIWSAVRCRSLLQYLSSRHCMLTCVPTQLPASSVEHLFWMKCYNKLQCARLAVRVQLTLLVVSSRMALIEGTSGLRTP